MKGAANVATNYNGATVNGVAYSDGLTITAASYQADSAIVT